jgi:hypothetical protein
MTTPNNATIDGLNYYDAVKAVRGAGHKGTWIAAAKIAVLKSLLKGELTEEQAKATSLGAAPAAGQPAAADILATALKAAVQPQIDDLRERLAHTADGLIESITDLQSKAGTKVEIPPTLLSDVANLKAGFKVVTDEIAKRSTKLIELTDAVKNALAQGNTAVAKVLAPAVGLPAPAASVDGDPAVAAMQRFCQPGAALKPILVKGGQGSGKTYGAREWGKKFDYYVEFGFTPETMPSDMFGFPTAKTDWVDGPIAKAWRNAAAGKKVFVLLDEIYRGQGAARDSMLTPLTPRTIDGKDYYAINTGRPLVDPTTGVEGTEELLAPTENIAIVATTNVGARFNVNPGDNAEKERFIIIHVEVDEPKLRSVVGAAVAAKKFSPAVTDRVIEFWKECRVLAADNFIEVCPSTRILTQGVLFAYNEADVPKSLALVGMNIWVAETLEGLPEQEQVKKVTAALKKHFPATK